MMYLKNYNLKNKTAVVTGAGKGLGRACAIALAEAGANLIIISRTKKDLDEVSKKIKKTKSKCKSYVCDITNYDQIKNIINKQSKIDILINNAGILRDRSFKNMTDDEWDAVVEVHLKGSYLATKHAWKEMLEQGDGGRIIMTSSTSGLIGNFGQTNYGAAKAGLAGFMRVLALEGMKYGITVNVLAPGALSRMTEDLPGFAGNEEEAKERMAPNKVSPTVAWLCTPEAANVTGRQFCVSGNRVSLLSWQVDTIAEKDSIEPEWTVDEIGEAMEKSMESWPKLLKPMEV